MSKTGPERKDLRVPMDRMMAYEAGGILGDPGLPDFVSSSTSKNRPDVRHVGDEMLKRKAGVGQRASK